MFPSNLVSCINEAAQTIHSRKPVNNSELRLFWQLKALKKAQFTMIWNKRSNSCAHKRNSEFVSIHFQEKFFPRNHLPITIPYLCIRKKKQLGFSQPRVFFWVCNFRFISWNKGSKQDLFFTKISLDVDWQWLVWFKHKHCKTKNIFFLNQEILTLLARCQSPAYHSQEGWIGLPPSISL